MTTARERYEAKTRVVTFRVHDDVFQQLEQVKTRTGLSFSDFVKLGAKIGEEEVKSKLAKANGLEARFAELRALVGEEQQRLDEFLSEEKERRLEELETQIKAFRLFDRGWSLEEVSFKLGIAETTLFHYLEEWAQMRKDKGVLKRELLKACLKKHIDSLKSQRSWAYLLPSTPEERLEDLERQIADCQHLLTTPSRITKQDRAFLLAEYSAAVSSAAKKMTGNLSGKSLERGTGRP